MAKRPFGAQRRRRAAERRNAKLAIEAQADQASSVEYVTTSTDQTIEGQSYMQVGLNTIIYKGSILQASADDALVHDFFLVNQTLPSTESLPETETSEDKLLVPGAPDLPKVSMTSANVDDLSLYVYTTVLS